MGPITLFDKSFLHGLHINESVWFDQFFSALISPLFYIETLGDLQKEYVGKIPGHMVATIAKKFPNSNGFPCAFHLDLSVANLLGQPICLQAQVPQMRGDFVNIDGEIINRYGQSIEEEAFLRWQKMDFKGVEHDFSKKWRQCISRINSETVKDELKKININIRTCKSHQEAKLHSEEIISKLFSSGLTNLLRVVFQLLKITDHQLQYTVYKKWGDSKYLLFSDFAPYAEHVVKIELFFCIAFLSGLIKNEPNSWCDTLYLHYLPFCSIFVSSDRDHEKYAELFMREDQQFVWGVDLKADLKKLNLHYDALPTNVKCQPIFKFAKKPPLNNDFLVSKIWDRHFPNWRTRHKNTTCNITPTTTKLKKIPTASPVSAPDSQESVSGLYLERHISSKKGNWLILPV